MIDVEEGLGTVWFNSSTVFCCCVNFREMWLYKLGEKKEEEDG